MAKRTAAEMSSPKMAMSNIKLENVRPIWLDASDSERYLLLEDQETGDVLMPLVYMKHIFESNYSRKLASLKHRQVNIPIEGPLSENSGLLYWQWAFESPTAIKTIVRNEIGEATPQGHLRLVLIPIVYNALSCREEYRDSLFFISLHRAIRYSTYWPLVLPIHAELVSAFDAKSGADPRNPPPMLLFRGPRILENTALKYMFMFPDLEEMELSKKNRTTGSSTVDNGVLTAKLMSSRMSGPTDLEEVMRMQYHAISSPLSAPPLGSALQNVHAPGGSSGSLAMQELGAQVAAAAMAATTTSNRHNFPGNMSMPSSLDIGGPSSSGLDLGSLGEFPYLHNASNLMHGGDVGDGPDNDLLASTKLNTDIDGKAVNGNHAHQAQEPAAAQPGPPPSFAAAQRTAPARPPANPSGRVAKVPQSGNLNAMGNFVMDSENEIVNPEHAAVVAAAVQHAAEAPVVPPSGTMTSETFQQLIDVKLEKVLREMGEMRSSMVQLFYAIYQIAQQQVPAIHLPGSFGVVDNFEGSLPYRSPNFLNNTNNINTHNINTNVAGGAHVPNLECDLLQQSLQPHPGLQNGANNNTDPALRHHHYSAAWNDMAFSGQGMGQPQDASLPTLKTSSLPSLNPSPPSAEDQQLRNNLLLITENLKRVDNNNDTINKTRNNTTGALPASHTNDGLGEQTSSMREPIRSSTPPELRIEFAPKQSQRQTDADEK